MLQYTLIELERVVINFAVTQRKIHHPCQCGCNKSTSGGDFKRGHDTKLLSALLQSVGGILELKRLLNDLNIN